jgi:hypothetical protein
MLGNSMAFGDGVDDELYIYGSLNRVSRVDSWSGRPDAASRRCG